MQLYFFVIFIFKNMQILTHWFSCRIESCFQQKKSRPTLPDQFSFSLAHKFEVGGLLWCFSFLLLVSLSLSLTATGPVRFSSLLDGESLNLAELAVFENLWPLAFCVGDSAAFQLYKGWHAASPVGFWCVGRPTVILGQILPF